MLSGLANVHCIVVIVSEIDDFWPGRSAYEEGSAVEAVKSAHEVVAARHFLRRHKQDFHARRVPAQTLKQFSGLTVFLSATQVAASNACLLQVEHLQHSVGLVTMLHREAS